MFQRHTAHRQIRHLLDLRLYSYFYHHINHFSYFLFPYFPIPMFQRDRPLRHLLRWYCRCHARSGHVERTRLQSSQREEERSPRGRLLPDLFTVILRCKKCYLCDFCCCCCLLAFLCCCFFKSPHFLPKLEWFIFFCYKSLFRSSI